MKRLSATLAIVILLFFVSPALAGGDSLNSGDTAWMIVSTALVMMMTPAGLALFYGGLSRSKNLLNTFAMTIIAYCLASLIWIPEDYMRFLLQYSHADITGGPLAATVKPTSSKPIDERSYGVDVIMTRAQIDF